MAAYDDQGDLEAQISAAQQNTDLEAARQQQLQIPAGSYGPTATPVFPLFQHDQPPGDLEVEGDLLKKGYSDSQVVDPYGIREGQPLCGIHEVDPQFQDVNSAPVVPQAAPAASQDAQAPQDAPTATPPVQAARQAVSGRSRPIGSQGGPDVEPPIDLSDGAQSSEHPLAAAAIAQGMDPTVARYLAAQQKLEGDLTAAQGRAKWAREEALGLNTMESAIGIGSDSVRAARMASAEAPVSDILARQEAAGKGLDQAGKEQDFYAKAEQANPDSPANKAFRAFYKQSNISLPPGLTLANGGGLAEKFLAHLDKQKDEERRIKQEREGKAEDYRRSEMQERHADWRASIKDKGDRAESNKNLSPEERKRMDEAFTGLEGIEDLQAKHKETGVGSAIADAVGIPTDYSRAKDAQVGPIGNLEYPGARGPNAAKFATQTLPTAKTPNAIADRQFNEFKKVGVSRLENYVKSQEAAHPNSPEVQDARRRLEEIKARVARDAGGGGAQRRGPDGRMRTKGADGLWHQAQ